MLSLLKSLYCFLCSKKAYTTNVDEAVYFDEMTRIALDQMPTYQPVK